MADGAGVPDEQGDYSEAALADPEADVDFTPGAVVEYGDPEDHGHEVEEQR